MYDEAVTARDCDEPWCSPGGGNERSIHVRDLNGDDEPEVLLDLYTGGAHCCVLTQVFTFDAPGYRKAAEHDWADAGYRIADVDGNGTPEIKSADARFAYAFAAFAFSGFPVAGVSLARRAPGGCDATLPRCRSQGLEALDARLSPRGLRAAGCARRVGRR